MADTYEKDLAQKTSLTTSDFIRVVGSDNVSYKQGMASVQSALGVSALISCPTISDLNTATSPNALYKYNSDASNKPTGLNYGYIFVLAEANGANTQQIVVGRGGTDAGPIWRRGRNNQGVWGSWEAMPTRAEVDALKNNQQRYADLTVNSGYVSIPITGMTATSSVICTLERSANTVGQMLIAYPQPSTNSLIVYVRKADGSTPTDGTVITISVRWI